VDKKGIVGEAKWSPEGLVKKEVTSTGRRKGGGDRHTDKQTD
jgi:hypothetical protein